MKAKVQLTPHGKHNEVLLIDLPLQFSVAENGKPIILTPNFPFTNYIYVSRVASIDIDISSNSPITNDTTIYVFRSWECGTSSIKQIKESEWSQYVGDSSRSCRPHKFYSEVEAMIVHKHMSE